MQYSYENIQINNLNLVCTIEYIYSYSISDITSYQVDEYWDINIYYHECDEIFWQIENHGKSSYEINKTIFLNIKAL